MRWPGVLNDPNDARVPKTKIGIGLDWRYRIGLDWRYRRRKEIDPIQADDTRGRQAAPRVNMHKLSHHAIGEIFVGIWEKMPCVFEQPFVFMAITLQTSA